MRNRYLLEVKTNKRLDATFGATLLRAWRDALPESLQLDRFDAGEPVRRHLTEEGDGAVTNLWAELGIPVMLARAVSPRLLMDMSWRENRGVDPRPFPWSCTVWLERKAGDSLARAMFRFLISQFEPAFGLLTTEADARAKHWFRFNEPDGGSVEAMRGLDVTSVLPGVYWHTFFGAPAVALLGAERSAFVATDAEPLQGGYLVRAYDNSELAGTPSAVTAEGSLIEAFGASKFFHRTLITSAAELRMPPLQARTH